MEGQKDKQLKVDAVNKKTKDLLEEDRKKLDAERKEFEAEKLREEERLEKISLDAEKKRLEKIKEDEKIQADKDAREKLENDLAELEKKKPLVEYVCVNKCFKDNRRYFKGNRRFFKNPPEKSKTLCWVSVEKEPDVSKDEEERQAMLLALTSFGLTPSSDMSLEKARSELTKHNANAAK
jgi:hypothetical protein